MWGYETHHKFDWRLVIWVVLEVVYRLRGDDPGQTKSPAFGISLVEG